MIDGKTIVIEHICGNQAKPAFYEINGEHLIGMLRFHAQILGDTSITEQQFLDFEAMEMTAEKKEEECKEKSILEAIPSKH